MLVTFLLVYFILVFLCGIIIDLVIKLGPPTFGTDGKYEYTVITSPGKIFSWILARDPATFREKYEAETLKYLQDNGYTYFWNKPRKSYQEKDCLYPGQLSTNDDYEENRHIYVIP